MIVLLKSSNSLAIVAEIAPALVALGPVTGEPIVGPVVATFETGFGEPGDKAFDSLLPIRVDWPRGSLSSLFDLLIALPVLVISGELRSDDTFDILCLRPPKTCNPPGFNDRRLLLGGGRATELPADEATDGVLDIDVELTVDCRRACPGFDAVALAVCFPPGGPIGPARGAVFPEVRGVGVPVPTRPTTEGGLASGVPVLEVPAPGDGLPDSIFVGDAGAYT